MKVKKPLKYLVYTVGGCICLICLIIIFYYFLLFKNPNPLAFFVPDGISVFVSVHKPDDVVAVLQNYLPEQAQKELRSGGKLPSAGLLGFLLGDEAVCYTASGSWGITAKISFPAKLALLFPGLITGVEITEESVRGNRITVLNINNTAYFLSSRWNILSLTPSRDIAGRTAELLNRRPVIAPLALNKDVRKIISGKGEFSEVYFSVEGFLKNTILQSEFKNLSSGGGVFNVSREKITSTLRLKGILGNSEDSLKFPEYSKAFFVSSFPCDINKIWLDFCYRVQGRDSKYNSFVVTLTSEIFDPIVKILKPAVFLYGFKGEKAGLSPSGVLCFETEKGVSEEKLVILVKGFIEKAQILNQERVKRSKMQKLTYAMQKVVYDGTAVYYIDIVPLAVSNFIPGFCMRGRRILVATDQRELKHVLAHLRKETKAVPQGYYMRLTDPGFDTLLGFLKRSLNDPSRKQRMGEAEFAKAIDRVNSAEKWSQGIGEITVQEKEEHSEFRTLDIQIKPVSKTGKPVNNKSQHSNSK